jgi:hypothetical protein
MKKIFFFLLMLTIEIQSSTAQNINDDNLAGKMQYGVPGHPWPELFKTFISSHHDNKKYYDVLCHTAEKICATIAQPPVVNPPRGFNINPYAGGNLLILPFPGGVKGLTVTFCDYPLYIDKNTRQVKQSGTWGSSIRLYVNDPEMLFNYSYRLEDDCDTAGVPEFSFRPAMHRDKDGFWVSEGVKNLQQVRIIKKKGVPLYAPLTQKEFLEFEIKFEQKDLVHCKKELIHDKKMAAKYPQDATFKNDVHFSEDNVTNTIKAIRDYQKSLNTMSPAELQQPAYTSHYFITPKGHYIFDLVPPNYKGAVEMVRLNPQYFDKTLPVGATQLIVVATAYSTRSASPDMIQKLKTWFGQINYQQLQALIK